MSKLRPLAPELAEVACNKLQEVPERLPQDIEELRSWIEQQAYLMARTDDQFLVAFLRFCKYNMDNAKKRIDYYYTYKSTTAMDLFKTRIQVDDRIMGICKAGIFATLPNPLGAGGPRIHYTRMGHIDTSVYKVHDIFRFHSLRSEIEINADDNWIISGVLEIVDFCKIPYAILRQFEPSLFRKMSAYLEHGVPTNLMGTHIINASKEAQLILGLMRMLMKQKELLHIHSNMESLQKAIGKEYLPVECGGTNGTLDEAIHNGEVQLLSYKDYFEEDVKYGVDESLRNCGRTPKTNTSSSNNDVDCVVGSFRKLNFD